MEYQQNKDGRYVPIGLLVSGLSIVLIIIVSWLFGVMADNSKTLSERQSVAHVRSAVNETKIVGIERRVGKLEQLNLNRKQ